MGAGENDYAQRDLRWTIACFAPLDQDKEFADHNRQLMNGWLAHWVPQALEAPARCSRCGRRPTTVPPGSRTASTWPRTVSPGSAADLGLDVPEELKL
jgi:propane monooxygenase small subunit